MKKIRYILVLLFLVSSGTAFGRDFNNCHISEIVLSGDVNAHIRLDCVISNTPSCAVATSYFAFDKSTEPGKQYLSLVMMAFAANMEVSGLIVKNENTCPAWQNNVALLAHLRATK